MYIGLQNNNKKALCSDQYMLKDNRIARLVYD